jgi:hypothetical protein
MEGDMAMEKRGVVEGEQARDETKTAGDRSPCGGDPLSAAAEAVAQRAPVKPKPVEPEKKATDHK